MVSLAMIVLAIVAFAMKGQRFKARFMLASSGLIITCQAVVVVCSAV